MNEPLVSVLIPTYNRAWHIGQTVQSALAQDYANIEVLVVDDASRDETEEVVKALADPRLTYARQTANVGMVANWGACLERAQGEFIVFLSDDDLLRPEFVAHRLPYLVDDDQAQVVFSRYDVVNKDGRLAGTRNENLVCVLRLQGRGLLAAALSHQWFVGAALYRREIVAHLWPQIALDNLVLDFGLNVRLALTGGSGVYIPDNDFVMMAHEGQNSQAKQNQVMREAEETLQRILDARPPLPYAAAMLRRELANWNVLWGRMLFAAGQGRAGRARFLRALHWYPGLPWAWRQLLLSCIAPRRLQMPKVKT